jgi:DNA polymerase V
MSPPKDLNIYGSVMAGFPSPALDIIENHLSLDSLLIHNSASTFIVRCTGDSMIGAGIFPGDLLIVDKSIKPKDGYVVIACLDGEFTVKRLRIHNSVYTLVPENPKYPLIKPIGSDTEFVIWGVVTRVIHDPNK